MESKTKIKISENKIKELIEYNFGSNIQVSKIQELNEGMMNSAYLITFAKYIYGYNEMVLKISFHSKADVLTYEKQILRAEVDFYKKMEGKNIPLPQLIKYDFTHNIIDCDYFFISRISGVLWKNIQNKLLPSNIINLKRELGKYNAIIHSTKGEYFGYVKEDHKWQFDCWAKAFEFMCINIINDGKERGYEFPYNEILSVIYKYENILNKIKEPKLVDFDLWAGNIFLEEVKGEYKISGIIDFERSFYGDPYADFTSAMLIYDDIEKEKEFLDGYSEVTGKKIVICQEDKIRMDLYRIYMNLVLGIETFKFEGDYAQQVLGYTQMQVTKLLKKLE